MNALPADVRRPRPAARPTAARVSLVRAPAPDEARRAPFVALIVLLVTAGLIALLVLNTAIAADSFTERSLNQQIEQLSHLEQQLQQEVDVAQAPAALAQAAAEQGMIPAGTPGFLVVHPDGTTQVVAKPKPASRRPAPPVTSP